MTNIVAFPTLPPTANHMRCLQCDGSEWRLLYTWQVECCKCAFVFDAVSWQFDVMVDECGEIHDEA